MAIDEQHSNTTTTVSDESKNTVTNASAATIPNTSRSSGKKTHKTNKSTKPALGKLKFSLTQSSERALRVAAIMLEDFPNAPNTPQEIVEAATITYLKKLRNSKVLEISLSLLPE
ncbi:hypothetical protein [Hymenobacter profundi]|uniref:Uncharacterized protein n=1 Tax=Hymenobacter profundi TaxID=1982110 RepID=A0ABS6WY55_9BACT|nr:hypothetical protein [Hymenobacter profundi]MBW3127708.1 hypothetical protein [Hymenobacter profundi]